MRVYLADLSYLSETNSTAIIPLCVGYVGSYLKKVMPGATVELFKDPGRLLDRISEEPPDVLALSNYTWNIRVNHAVTKRARNIHPEMAIVLGGPSFDEHSPDWIKKFFTERPQVDLYITGEGELSFAKFMELWDRNGGRVRNIPLEDWPDSFFGFDPVKQEILHNPHNHQERADLADIPSPYLTGLLDSFLDEGLLQPIIETNRGCPYSCTFCCWGATTKSRLNEFPLQTVYDEITYITDRCTHPSRMLFMADGNFGILKRDLEISRFLKENSEARGFPKSTYVYFAKNSTQMVIDIATNLKTKTQMSMSKQSLNGETLDLIKRKNISNEKYDELRKECERRGNSTYCELIYGMPGETYQSFMEGAISTIAAGQTVNFQPLRTDAGAEVSTTESRQKFGIKTAYRALPRSMGSYGDLHFIEYDEIVVENNFMTREEFFLIRLFHFMIFVFTQSAFAEFNRQLRIGGLNYGILGQKIIEDEAHWTPLWGEIIRGFKAASREELIPEHLTKLDFTDEDLAHFKEKEVALNPYFMSRLVSRQSVLWDFKEYLLGALRRFFGSQLEPGQVEDIEQALLISFDRLICFENLTLEKMLACKVDLDAWMSSEIPRSLSQFKVTDPLSYSLVADPGIKLTFERALERFGDVARAVYHLRMGVIGDFSSNVYSYQRQPALTSCQKI